MSETCTKHGMQFWDAKMGDLKSNCPYCQLSAIQAELEEAKQHHKDVCECNAMDLRMRDRNISSLVKERDLLRNNIIHCDSCGASWYADGFTASCPICKLAKIIKERDELRDDLVKHGIISYNIAWAKAKNYIKLLEVENESLREKVLKMENTKDE